MKCHDFELWLIQIEMFVFYVKLVISTIYAQAQTVTKCSRKTFQKRKARFPSWEISPYSKLKRSNIKSRNYRRWNGRKLTCLSTESREIFNLFCCWCSKKGFDASLVFAGRYRAITLATQDHLRDLIVKWIEMVTKLNDEAALHLLSCGDVASNERNYQS